MNRTLAICLLSGLVFLLLLVYFVFWAPNTFEGDRFIIVSKGESFSQVADSLAQSGVVRSRLLFVTAGRVLGLTTRMRIGKYRFRSGLSNREILDDLQRGKSVVSVTLSLQEGLKTARLARMYHRSLGIDSSRFVSLASDPDFIRGVGVEGKTLEGYLLPNTYSFYWQADETEVLKGMVGSFWKFFNDTLMTRLKKRKMTLSDVLTMASIVEWETAIDSERAIVAGVYFNRLARRMRLDADPTVQYILGDRPRPLKRSDLRRESPYNTYLHYGLPPGPLNNPGKASILAALYPKRHRYLYFVANGSGGHTFSVSYGEHQKAVRKLQKLRKEQEALRYEAGGSGK